MNGRLLIVGAVLAATLAATPADAQRRRVVRTPAPAAVNWTERAVRTPEGGYLLGNPAARVKIVEYGSIGCPHCAQFAAEAMTPLKQTYIRTGRVSYEFRPLAFFDSDAGIYMRLLCQTPRNAVATLERLYATQATWRGRVRAHEAELEAMPPEQRLQAAYRYADVGAMLATPGATSCTPPAQDVQRLSALQDQAQRDGITGVPAFLINGVRQDGVGLWNDPANPALSLEPKLRAALSAR